MNFPQIRGDLLGADLNKGLQVCEISRGEAGFCDLAKIPHYCGSRCARYNDAPISRCSSQVKVNSRFLCLLSATGRWPPIFVST